MDKCTPYNSVVNNVAFMCSFSLHWISIILKTSLNSCSVFLHTHIHTHKAFWTSARALQGEGLWEGWATCVHPYWVLYKLHYMVADCYIWGRTELTCELIMCVLNIWIYWLLKKDTFCCFLLYCVFQGKYPTCCCCYYNMLKCLFCSACRAFVSTCVKLSYICYLSAVCARASEFWRNR